MTSAISIEGLSVSYERKRVLTNIYLEIEKGNIYGIIGPNGAGKSTLFKAMLGLIEVNTGKVEFAGQSIKKIRKQVVYVPQTSDVDWSFPATVFDIVLMGRYPHKKILVNRISYDKNPIYGLNQLPKFLNPFTGIFEWDIKMFKVLTRKYLENTILVNRRDDIWLLDGIQTYLMMNYVETYYPEIKALGNISKIWGVRSYSIAKLDFNDKYPFVYQFAARKI